MKDLIIITNQSDLATKWYFKVIGLLHKCDVMELTFQEIWSIKRHRLC